MSVKENFVAILGRIEAACLKSNRTNHAVHLVGVSKKQTSNAMQEFIDACAKRNYQCILGENYVQEFEEKKPQLTGSFTSHFIGHLQTNKAKTARALFDCIQSVDSLKLAVELSKHAERADVILPIFLEVNVSGDVSKFGFEADIETFRDVFSLPGITVQGLMTITMDYDSAEEARPDFKALATLAKKVEQEFMLKKTLELSMGMSNDFEVAIEEGATIVRVGTLLFGTRQD